MGLLDQMLGQGGLGGARPGGGRKINSALVGGVVMALAIQAMRSRSGAAESRSYDPRGGAGEGGLGGVLGGLGGMLGGGGAGGGLGGMLGGLGAAGALGALVSQLQNKGLGSQVNSWVGTGQNEPVAPNQLVDALGEDTVEELQSQTGLPRDELLAQLARELPEAMNQATPTGQLPSDDDLGRIA